MKEIKGQYLKTVHHLLIVKVMNNTGIDNAKGIDNANIFKTSGS